MSKIINTKGVRRYVHSKGKKIGAVPLDALERFLKQSLYQWCENANKQGKQILIKSTCPIDKISEEALREQ